MARTPARQTESAQLARWLQTWTTRLDTTCFIASFIIAWSQVAVLAQPGLPRVPLSYWEYGTTYAMMTLALVSVIAFCIGFAVHLATLTLYTGMLGIQCYVTWLCWTTEARLEQLISLVAIAYCVIAQRAICLKQRQLFEARRN